MNRIKSHLIALGLASAIFVPSGLYAGGVHHLPQFTVENWATSNIYVAAASFTPLDSATTINCQQVGGCTIIAETSAQMQTSADNNGWSLCLYVDGSAMNGGCLHAGDLKTLVDIVGHARANAKVAMGKHKVQTFAFFSGAFGYVTWYQSDYSVYSP